MPNSSIAPLCHPLLPAGSKNACKVGISILGVDRFCMHIGVYTEPAIEVNGEVIMASELQFASELPKFQTGIPLLSYPHFVMSI